jgi:hypothetical protein
MGTNGDIRQNQPWTAHFFAIRKVVTKIHNSKSDLTLVLLVLPINVKKPIITIQGVLGGHMVVFMDENVIIHTNMTTNAVSNHKK